jgi:hypothetical protein
LAENHRVHDTSRQHGEQAGDDERAEADRRPNAAAAAKACSGTVPDALSNGVRPMVGASMRQPKALP